ncbi:unnamed protein product [Bemisia tabaci]|uniref:Uncharacterized protein n=1 Tax=Bemisia tabaci TaxID=7038 RepID=A0A9P0AL24_BEMTA|nr:unnamed protein product [Bemisia tabaci]
MMSSGMLSLPAIILSIIPFSWSSMISMYSTKLIGKTYPFSGCISDVTINREIVNFAKVKANKVVIGTCIHGEHMSDHP